MKRKKRLYLLGDVLGILGAIVVFIVPFVFMLVNALKERREANLLSIGLPKETHWENFIEVFKANDYQILTAFKNSGLLVVGSVLILIVVGSMGGYVLQRRKDSVMGVMNSLIMAGLMVPAAILPTIWVLQKLHLYKTIGGMIMVEVALQIPFTIMLFRGFMSSIPIELEEAGYMDGCSRWKIFTTIIFPLLKPVTSTVIILNAVTIFNDFTNPLYFLPGSENATVQLTLYNFMGQYSSSYNMLFADVILITVPMLLLFIFFNKRIVDGMVAGAVKG
ncbi:carbohydrate ABC transporter permease [Faecalicatena contorta]|uniref:Raffinose/stachyose/melibiose transport system permease protein n=1 Tax=Faecalicatena contorta TaxID=39482 RepID=A0A315ZQA2_9FIRM|nr:carbohydrate ABC transporter permease [Faecalicatena contorta]PWJ47078.1 raffinose/stachyose/melibiose transport system permease protein [Faecalicatena contorta]SUQ16179.1 raffinose/stachyose/melibiose transport system permease protein [Faecalicatena contorta]